MLRDAPAPFPGLVIGLRGPADVGKSTTARMLCEVAAGWLSPVYAADGRPGVGVHLSAARGAIVSLAAPLKAMLIALGVEPRHLYGSKAEKEEPLPQLGGRSARHAMKTLGTEWGRDLVHPMIWLWAWERAVLAASKATPTPSIIVCDDVRFDNEVNFIAVRGGVCVELRREGVAYEETHESERPGWADFVFVLPTSDDPTIRHAAARNLLETVVAHQLSRQRMSASP